MASEPGANVVTQRPAEATTIVAAVIAVLVAFNVPLNEGQTAAIIGFVGVVPGVVTWVVERFKH